VARTGSAAARAGSAAARERGDPLLRDGVTRASSWGHSGASRGSVVA
jgi:hypothetical protein